MGGLDTAALTELLVEGAARLGARLSGEDARLFMAYMELMLAWNERVNLTAITDPRDVVTKHFLDSLTVLPELDFAPEPSLIDVGTGAGLPGIPLAIARPGLRLTLLDSLNKRVEFLERAVETLGINGARCLHARAEDAGRDPAHRQAHDVCVARAVANLATLAEYALPFVKLGGKFISMKGPLEGGRLKEEINGAKAVISELGGEVAAIKPVRIPFTDIEHSLVIVRKLADTPPKYPRKAGKIPKSPIG